MGGGGVLDTYQWPGEFHLSLRGVGSKHIPMAVGISQDTTWGFSKPIKLGSYTIARQNVGISFSVHDDQSQKNQVIYPTKIFGSKTHKGPTKFIQKDC